MAFAANHFVRAGATGNGSGSDWANACTDFTGSCAVASLVRGDTYYIAAGTYPGRTFNRATSGTSAITVKRATVGDHGTDIGWSDSFDAQVVFSSAVSFDTSFWVFNGVIYPPTAAPADGSQTAANYGFRVGRGCGVASANMYLDGNNITVIGVAAPNSCGKPDTTIWGFNVGSASTGCSNITISHVFTENNITDFQKNGGQPCSAVTIEYAATRGQYTATSHGEGIAWGGDNAIIRYNWFDGCVGTGCIASNGPTLNGFKIYGNVFNNVTNGGTGCGNGGNGAIAGASSARLNNFEIYNNTIIQPGMCFGWFYDNGGSGNIAKNNIIKQTCDYTGTLTHDSNYYLSCMGSSPAPTETNRQTSAVDPFLDVAGKNFHLLADTSAWSPVNSPYDVDPEGLPRTSSRGAYQFSTTTSQRPAAPQGLQATVR